MNETLFGNETVDTNLPQIDPEKDYYQELVGDNKKFRSEKELARGKYEADLYIKTLERRLDESRNDYMKLRQDSMAGARLEELIDQLKSQQLASSETTPANEVPNTPGINPVDIENLVTSKIREEELRKKQMDNLNTVRNKLTERYGSEYQSYLQHQIETLGLDAQDVDNLARKSPSAFFKTLGLDSPDQRETFQTPMRSSQRNDSFAPKGAQKRTWSYYQNMKKTNPTLYGEPQTTVQMHKDYAELGDAFEDGDFNMR